MHCKTNNSIMKVKFANQNLKINNISKVKILRFKSKDVLKIDTKLYTFGFCGMHLSTNALKNMPLGF